MDCECPEAAQQCHVCCIGDNEVCTSTFVLFQSTNEGQVRPAGVTCNSRQGLCDNNGE